ncbi:3971_t:CDS:1 [Ambispora leptoticha]|uniref:3971_t:CDS:1 n=1 Tax=Ambispora leptoticha TaxID=144679 RepID=A0A9N9AU45_9GLOM|nr:3971_t:CDS:1 [Ambispora leptoticha]
MIVVLALPILSNGLQFTCIQCIVSIISAMFILKLSMWAKKIYAIRINEKNSNKKENQIDSFFSTLSHIRNSIVLPRDHTRYHQITSSGQITPPITYDSHDNTQLLLPTKTYLAKFIVKRLHIFFGKWLLYVSLATIVENFQPKTYEKFYIYRVLGLFRNVIFGDNKGDSSITSHELLWHYLCSGVLYLSMNFTYEAILLNSALILYALLPADQKDSTTSTTIINKNTPTIDNIASKLLHLSPKRQIAIRGWCTHMVFYSPTLFNNPGFSSSPRDLWSNRWHQGFSEQFKQLAFYPTHNLVIKFGGNKKLACAMGAVSCFLLSGLMHEYILYAFIGAENNTAGHQFLFFVVHAVMFVVWEGVENTMRSHGGNKEKKEICHDVANREKKSGWIKIIIWNIILISTLPLFIEPYRRRTHCMMHFYCTANYVRS